MSRSRKGSDPQKCSWWPSDGIRSDGRINPDTDNDGQGDEKAGAHRVVQKKTLSGRQGWILTARRRYGSTEKILRRNRKMWARKFSKEGRRLDKQEIKVQSNED